MREGAGQLPVDRPIHRPHQATSLRAAGTKDKRGPERWRLLFFLVFKRVRSVFRRRDRSSAPEALPTENAKRPSLIRSFIR